MQGVTIATYTELASKYFFEHILLFGMGVLSATRGVDFSLLPGGSHTYPMIIAIFNFAPLH